jgi:hypothetical protein
LDDIVYSTPSKSKRGETYSFTPAASFNELLEALQVRSDGDTLPTLSSKGKSRTTSKGKSQGRTVNSERPSVILACDEAHTLTDIIQEEQDVEWSKFSEFRHALRGLNHLPLFSLFLSTTGKIQQFTSKEDVSRRITEGKLTLIQPFTDLGFDTLATKVSLDGSWDLKKVTEDEHIVHLGRPLCVEPFHTLHCSYRLP